MNGTRSLGIGPVGAFMPGEDVMEPAPLVSREMLQAFGPSLLSRMREADAAQQQRWQAGERSPTPMTEDRAWLADDVAGSLLGPMGIMGAIKAYHGSPHRFDRFDMSKIGTGEGAQAFGHGLYFSEAPGVAQSYKDMSAGWTAPTPRALQTPMDMLEQKFDAKLRQFAMGGTAFEEARKMALRDVSDELGYYKRDFDNYGLTQEEAAGKLKEYAESLQQPGALYTTRLDVEPEDLLDWDAPLSQQSEKVRQNITNAFMSAFGDLGPRDLAALREFDGREIHQELAGKVGKDAASAALREAGIPGIRYLDQGSRASGEGTRNFVIFDDKLIDIEGVE